MRERLERRRNLEEYPVETSGGAGVASEVL